MFQYQAIERLEQPPTIWTFKGTLVHSALEGLFSNHAPEDRTLDAALRELDAAVASEAGAEGFASLDLGPVEQDRFVEDARGLVRRYFDIEDPRSIDAVGVELRLETDIDASGTTLQLRGIIDRLDRADNGDLTIVDYKTGRAPMRGRERSKLAAVETYALLCERVLGVRPVAVRLLHLKEPVVIERRIGEAEVTRQERRTVQVWDAIERAYATGSFRPSPGPLCRFCAFSDRCEGALAMGVTRAS
jgi:putative RecB family exonuclease